MTRWASSPGLSIRSRLTAWYTVVLFLMMLVYAAATYVAVRHEFLDSSTSNRTATSNPAPRLETACRRSCGRC